MGPRRRTALDTSFTRVSRWKDTSPFAFQRHFWRKMLQPPTPEQVNQIGEYTQQLFIPLCNQFITLFYFILSSQASLSALRMFFCFETALGNFWTKRPQASWVWGGQAVRPPPRRSSQQGGEGSRSRSPAGLPLTGPNPSPPIARPPRRRAGPGET